MSLQNILLPPWLHFPQYERYSIAYRMGAGEEYIGKLGKYFESLSPKQIAQYQATFPEPITWAGWYEDDCKEELITGEDLGLKGSDFFVQTWQKNGKPKYDLKWLQNYSQSHQVHYCFFYSHKRNKLTSSLSQWYSSNFDYLGQEYCCMEQMMMASKAQLFNAQEIMQKILQSKDPKEIKQLGRMVPNFSDQIWDQVKHSIVLNGNFRKFISNVEIRDFLINTKDAILVEASPYDRIWGIGMEENNQNINNLSLWGQNMLGFALMEVRDELQRIAQYPN